MELEAEFGDGHPESDIELQDLYENCSLIAK